MQIIIFSVAVADDCVEFSVYLHLYRFFCEFASIEAS